MKQIYLILIIVILSGCNKQHESQKSQVNVMKSDSSHFNTQVATAKKRFEPQHPTFSVEGTAVLNDDKFTVVQEYTNAIAYKQPAVNEQRVPDTLYYREMLIHFINKDRADTLTISKLMFRKDMGKYYDRFVMQAILFNQPSTMGTIPLMVNLCIPDTDNCIYYTIDVDNNGKLKTKPFNEEDFADEE